jgi:hypothetical protein
MKRSDGYDMRVAVVRVTCDTCGTVDLSPYQCRAQIIELVDPIYNINTLEYTCPSCKRPQEYRFESTHVPILSAAHVKIKRVHVPKEVYEPRGGANPRLTSDDLLDFCIVLRDM